MILSLLCGISLAAFANGLYSSSDDVIELTAGNFDGKVIHGDEVWMVEFYAPWCGHCKSLAPEWKKAATRLKGVVKVGAVDMDVHSSVGGPYNVRGFPTIKIFAGNKKSPQDYNGARTEQGIIDAALKAASDMVKHRSSQGGQRSSGGGGSSGGGSGSGDHVVELTDANFEKEVFGTKDLVLVEFFAPWCGHCQRLAPEWKNAASELNGKVKVAALDATVHTIMASKFQVQGYPTIKYFPAGAKDVSSAQEYDGGRTASDIVQWALSKYVVDVDPPKIEELLSNDVLKVECTEKPLCVVAVLPHILDSQADGRNGFIKMLRELGEEFKQKQWGWIWTSAGEHPSLENSLGLGGFGYPAMVMINIKKKVFVTHKGGFQKDSIQSSLKALSVGRGRTDKIEDLPELKTVAAWDGLDGAPPAEEELDLSDVELDDLDDLEDPHKDEL